jgi:cytochrome c biogenesis protein
MGFTGFFYPTFGLGQNGPRSTFPGARDPVLILAAWRGDLGLDSGAPQSVYDLPVARLHHVANGDLTPGRTWRLADGTSVTFQVAHDPGKRLVLAAAVLVVAGLLTSLRVRRRRLWVRALPATGDGPGRTVVQAAGLARSEADGFAEEFTALVQRLRD